MANPNPINRTIINRTLRDALVRERPNGGRQNWSFTSLLRNIFPRDSENQIDIERGEDDDDMVMMPGSIDFQATNQDKPINDHLMVKDKDVEFYIEKGTQFLNCKNPKSFFF